MKHENTRKKEVFNYYNLSYVEDIYTEHGVRVKQCHLKRIIQASRALNGIVLSKENDISHLQETNYVAKQFRMSAQVLPRHFVLTCNV